MKEVCGTSFGLNVEGKLVLVTNRHIVDLNFGRTDAKYIGFTLRHLICEIRARDTPSGQPGVTRRLIVPMTHNQLSFDANPRNDVVIIFDVQTGNVDGSNDRQWDYCFSWSDVATEQELRNELEPFDVLAFPGFPTGFDKLGLRAVIRGGTVACDPRFDYSFESEDRGEILLYEGFSFGGSSGSPVIAIPKVPPINVNPHPANRFRRLLLVGVNAGHLTMATGQHAGLSYFVRSSVIRRLVEPHLTSGNTVSTSLNI